MTYVRFENLEGRAIQGFKAVVPIFKAEEFPKLTCIATGFFIHTGGVLVTAAHVVREILDKKGQQLEETGLAVLHYIPPHGFQIRWVSKVSMHLVSDIAILCLQTLYDKATNEPIRNKVLITTTSIPPPGSGISTWAYPEAIHFASGNVRGIKIWPKLYTGTISQEHRDGRDTVILPGSCYETTLAIEGGASGGPVFDEKGPVFAVNSTGFDGTEISYVSHIQRIGGLPIAHVKTSDGVIHDNITISELIKRGEIVVHKE